MTSGHLRKQIHGRGRWEKKLGDGEPGAPRSDKKSCKEGNVMVKRIIDLDEQGIS